MNVTRVRSRVDRFSSLPSVSEVILRLMEMLEDPNLSIREIGEVLGQDPGLTARVLKAVNSPIYGFIGRISSVTQALLLLGLNSVKGILVSICANDLMKKSMTGLWEHSMGAAVMVKAIANKKHLSLGEETSIAALLHDLGKVVLFVSFPDDYAKALQLAESEKLFIREAEERCFETTHAQVGEWVAKKWNFPRSLIEPVRYHHRPELGKSYPIQCAALHVSDALVRAIGFGFPGDLLVPPIDPAALTALNLSDKEVEEILEEAQPQLEEARDFWAMGDEDH
jgi:HD-like signal output (HDOD) protein